MKLANLVTISRILFIPVFILILLSDIMYKEYIAAIVFCLMATTDSIDGWIARRRKEVSETGAMLDLLADKLLISAALIFLIGKGVVAWMAYVIIAREIIITGLRVLIKEILHAGWLGKLKTFSQVIGIICVLINFYAFQFMLAATILTAISGIDYIWRSRRLISL